MQITARYTPQSIQEATDLNRHLWQRAIRLATGARALVYLIGGLWLGFLLLARGLRTPAVPLYTYSGAAVLFAVTTIAVLANRRRAGRIDKLLRAHPDQQISLDFNGVTLTPATGIPTFEPWPAFSTFHEGTAIVALTRHGRSPALAIPIDSLSPTQTGELRSILLTHLPEKL